MTGVAQTNNLAARLNKTFSDAHQRLVAEPNDPEVAWKFSRACFDLADTAPNNTQRAEFANQGITAAQRSLAENNNAAAAHYYLGMNIGQLADTKHNLSGLRMVKDMEREFLAACALDEHFDYGGPDRNLGLLYWEAPIIASIGSRSKARQHLERAVALAPDFLENRLNLIEAYLKWDYHAEALRELQNLETIWPDAQKKFTGDEWASTWADWNKRLNVVKKKLDDTTKIIASPHSAP
jgi:tetratricopeptide (TPR) repeat protein